MTAPVQQACLYAVCPALLVPRLLEAPDEVLCRFWGVRLRASELSDAEYAELSSALTRRLGPLPVKCILDFRPALPELPGCAGFHLRSGQLSQTRYARKDRLLIASAHAPEDLPRFRAAGIRAATLSPVLPPATPKPLPAAPALGFDALKKACALVPDMAVFALGGMKLAHRAQALACGCRGIAGISLIEEVLGSRR